MGPLAVLDRFRQIAPKVLIACDGYAYGGVVHERASLLPEIVAELPSIARRRPLAKPRSRRGGSRRLPRRTAACTTSLP